MYTIRAGPQKFGLSLKSETFNAYEVCVVSPKLKFQNIYVFTKRIVLVYQFRFMLSFFREWLFITSILSQTTTLHRIQNSVATS